MSRKVNYARLHAAAHIPSVGDLGLVLPPTGKTLDGLIMVRDGDELLLSFMLKGVEVTAAIPKTNVSIMVFAPEPTKPALKVAKG